MSRFFQHKHPQADAAELGENNKMNLVNRFLHHHQLWREPGPQRAIFGYEKPIVEIANYSPGYDLLHLNQVSRLVHPP
jgi:hypothetical protein